MSRDIYDVIDGVLPRIGPYARHDNPQQYKMTPTRRHIMPFKVAFIVYADLFSVAADID